VWAFLRLRVISITPRPKLEITSARRLGKRPRRRRSLEFQGAAREAIPGKGIRDEADGAGVVDDVRAAAGVRRRAHLQGATGDVDVAGEVAVGGEDTAAPPTNAVPMLLLIVIVVPLMAVTTPERLVPVTVEPTAIPAALATTNVFVFAAPPEETVVEPPAE